MDTGTTDTDRQPAVTVVGHRNIPFRETDARTLDLDIYRPPDATPGDARPIVVFIYGGAWASGTNGQFARYALDVASGTKFSDEPAGDGSVAVELTYRLTDEARFPAQIVDVHAALDWLGEHAEVYGGDPDRLAIVGHSAGAHLAALASLTREHPDLTPPDSSRPDEPPSVEAVAGISGVYDFDRSPAHREEFAELLADHDADRSLAAQRRLASPVTHVSQDIAIPPMLLLHGGADEVVPPAQSERYRDVLETAGAIVDSAIVPDADHVFLHSAAHYPATHDRIVSFFHEYS